MRKYELAVIIDAASTKKAQETFVSEIENQIKAAGGKPGKVDVWDKKELAYPIKKQNEGFYILFPFEVPPDKIKEIEIKLKLNEKILSYLLLTV